MNTIELTLHVPDHLHEFLIAELTDLDFEGFVQEEDRLLAYVPAPRWSDVKREHVERWLLAHGTDAPLIERVVRPQNWNARWEETIRPLAVGPFLVKPTWTDVPPEHAGKILLEVDPKMSFGTGYHESTRLVLRALPDLVRTGARVLDAGTGTGILAIAALKLGAATAVAFDVDPWAQANAVENFYLNAVAERVTFRAGPIDVVDETDFDLVLANINRNALLDLLPAFAEKTKPGGRLALAGLLRQDRERMLEAAAHAFTPVHEATEGEWWSGVWEREEEEERKKEGKREWEKGSESARDG